MRRERLSPDDLARLDAARPPRKVYRNPPDLPVHFEGFTGPAPCGLPPGAWAARTHRPDLVTCPGCRRLQHMLLIPGVRGAPLPPGDAIIPAIRELARAASLTS